MHKSLDEFEFPALLRLKNYCCEHTSVVILQWIVFILAGDMDNHDVSDVFSQIQTWTAELAALEYLKKITINLQVSFLIGSSSFFQEIRTCIKTWMGFYFNEIQPLTCLAALEHLKMQFLRIGLYLQNQSYLSCYLS